MNAAPFFLRAPAARAERANHALHRLRSALTEIRGAWRPAPSSRIALRGPHGARPAAEPRSAPHAPSFLSVFTRRSPRIKKDLFPVL